MRLLEFFQESSGMLSNMRLNATVLVATGCFILIHGALGSTLTGESIGAALGAITIGIGGKAIQKGSEPAPPAGAAS